MSLECWRFYIDGKGEPLYVVAASLQEAASHVNEWAASIEKAEFVGEGYYVPEEEGSV